MNTKILLALLLTPLLLTPKLKAETPVPSIGPNIQAVDPANILSDPDWYIWGGSLCKDKEGTYHLLYSRWPKKTTFFGWATHSEIARATSKSPNGPFTHQDVALPARNGKYWDGKCTHNPHVRQYNGKYYLYYMGNTGDGKITRSYNFSHRNSQRIGVAVADHPAGPWKRTDTPLLDISPDPKAPDALCLNNPTVTKTPEGKYYMIYKAVAKKKPLPFGGPVYHCSAIADQPEGPFKKLPGLIFHTAKSDFPAEDPYMWHDGTRYNALAKDMKGALTGFGTAIVQLQSPDGKDWKPAPNALVTKPKINWLPNTKKMPAISRLERPQLYIENGIPLTLFVGVLDKSGNAYNVPIPLKK